MKMHLQPLVALCDEKINISFSDIPPLSKVKISASMCLPWAKSVPYESFAWFTADSTGHVDLSKQKPDSGTYDFVDSMGPILSMQSKDKNAIKKIGQNISVNESIFIDISAECGQERASAKLERLFKTPEIKSKRISDVFVGELFYTENPGNKTIVFFGGSGSGLAVNSPIATLLASHGFNVLSVAYFGEKGLPARPSEIPLEYFVGLHIKKKNNTKIKI